MAIAFTRDRTPPLDMNFQERAHGVSYSFGTVDGLEGAERILASAHGNKAVMVLPNGIRSNPQEDQAELDRIMESTRQKLQSRDRKISVLLHKTKDPVWIVYGDVPGLVNANNEDAAIGFPLSKSASRGFLSNYSLIQSNSIQR